MPVATVHKDHGLVFRKNKVRFARQIFPVEPISQTLPVAFATDEHFGLRAAALNARHVIRASFPVVYVQSVRRYSSSFEQASCVRP